MLSSPFCPVLAATFSSHMCTMSQRTIMTETSSHFLFHIVLLFSFCLFGVSPRLLRFPNRK